MSQSRIYEGISHNTQKSHIAEMPEMLIPEILDEIRARLSQEDSLKILINFNQLINVFMAAALNQSISEKDKKEYLENENILNHENILDDNKPRNLISQLFTVQPSKKIPLLFSLLKIIQNILTNKPLDKFTLTNIMKSKYYCSSIPGHYLLYLLLHKNLLTLEMLTIKSVYPLKTIGLKELTAYQAFLQDYDIKNAAYPYGLASTMEYHEPRPSKYYLFVKTVNSTFKILMDQLISDAVKSSNLTSINYLYDSGLIDAFPPLDKQRILNACLNSKELSQDKFEKKCEFIAKRAPLSIKYSVPDQMYLRKSFHLTAYKTNWIHGFIAHFAIQSINNSNIKEIGDIFSYFNNKHIQKSGIQYSIFNLISRTHMDHHPLAKFFPQKGTTEQTSWEIFLRNLTKAYHDRLDILVKEEDYKGLDKKQDNSKCIVNITNR